MLLRPLDSSGDILPVLSSTAMLRGGEAVAALVESRLNLLSGEWWENRGVGNEILSMLSSSRLTESDAASVSSYLTSYILATPGVHDVRDVSCSVSGRRLSFSCTVITDSESALVTYSFQL